MTTKSMKIINKITGGLLTLGKVIRSIRECDEINQDDFAKLLHVTQSYLNDLENDKKEVSPSKAIEFAKILEQSEKQFIRLSIQDSLHRKGIEYDIEIKDSA